MHIRVYMSSSLAIARRRDLVDDPIPSEPRIIDNDMDLPTTKLRRFLHKIIDVFRIQHVTRYSDGGSASLGDFVDDGSGFGCSAIG